MIQASFAGLFLSVIPDARFWHMIFGAFLGYFALALVPVAIVQRRRRRCASWIAVGAGLVPVLVWVQEALGHMPFPITTAVHVPLGVALLAYVVVLAVAANRPLPVSNQ